VYHRAAVLLVAVVLMAFCGVGNGQDDVPALIQQLQAKSDTERRSAARALGKIGPAAREAVPALVATLEDSDPLVRWSARDALCKIGPAAVPALIAAVKDNDRRVRRGAALALGQIGPAARDAIPALEAAARDGVYAAKRALKQIRGER